MTFGVTGGLEAGKNFYDALKLVKRLVNLGDAKSLACHPASTTHRQMSAEEQRKAGVRPEMIRLSIGIEHIDDIIADLDQALAAANRGTRHCLQPNRSPRRARPNAALAGHRAIRRPRVRTANCLKIGLVNNMPDAAIDATERQFVELVGGHGRYGRASQAVRAAGGPAQP